MLVAKVTFHTRFFFCFLFVSSSCEIMRCIRCRNGNLQGELVIDCFLMKRNNQRRPKHCSPSTSPKNSILTTKQFWTVRIPKKLNVRVSHLLISKNIFHLKSIISKTVTGNKKWKRWSIPNDDQIRTNVQESSIDKGNVCDCIHILTSLLYVVENGI